MESGVLTLYACFRTAEERPGSALAKQDDAASYGVTDEIARRVPLTGGRGLAVRRHDLPDPTPVAAILRHRF